MTQWCNPTTSQAAQGLISSLAPETSGTSLSMTANKKRTSSRGSQSHHQRPATRRPHASGAVSSKNTPNPTESVSTTTSTFAPRLAMIEDSLVAHPPQMTFPNGLTIACVSGLHSSTRPSRQSSRPELNHVKQSLVAMVEAVTPHSKSSAMIILNTPCAKHC